MARAINLSPRAGWLSRPTEWPELGAIGEWLRLGGEPIRIEEFVENDTFVVRAELPGVDPDVDVEVSISGGMLHVGATRERPADEKVRRHLHSEFRYGTFSRTLPLPTGAFESEVKATYENGILEVRLPLMATPAHRIPIQHH